MFETILIDPPQINIEQMNRHLTARQKERMRAKIRLKIDCDNPKFTIVSHKAIMAS